MRDDAGGDDWLTIFNVSICPRSIAFSISACLATPHNVSTARSTVGGSSPSHSWVAVPPTVCTVFVHRNFGGLLPGITSIGNRFGVRMGVVAAAMFLPPVLLLALRSYLLRSVFYRQGDIRYHT